MAEAGLKGNYFTGLVITLCGSILFSTKAILVKLAYRNAAADPLDLLMLRMVCSLPFFVIAAVWVGRDKERTTITRRQWVQIITLGLFGYYLSSTLDFYGLQYISAGLERLILFLYPSLVALINLLVFRQPLRKMQLAALVLTYAGIAIAYGGEWRMESGREEFIWGSSLIFLCAVTFTVYIAGSGRLIPKIGASRFNAYAMLAATGGIFVHYILRGNYDMFYEGREIWGYGIVMALLATVVPSFLIAAGMKRIGSNNAAIVSSVGPVSTILQAHVFLGEPVLMEQLIGTVLVVAGVILTGWRFSSQDKG